MSASQNDPTDRRRGRSRRSDATTPRVCRACRDAPALPGDETCAACGEQAIARTRAGVEIWLHMHGERVRELERNELARGGPA